MISSKDLKHVVIFHSNHVRRTNIEKVDNAERLAVPGIIKLYEWNHYNDTLNLLVGDSHAEFLGRLFFDLAENMGVQKLVNQTYVFTTGATTLVGAIQSEHYFNNLLRSLTMIIEVLRQRIKFSRINIIFSLGEIDVRTKVFIESFTKRISFEDILKDCCGPKLVDKLALMKTGLKSLFGSLETKIFFKKPPPPSAVISFSKPQHSHEMVSILKGPSFPAFLSVDERLEIYQILIPLLQNSCKQSEVEFLESSNKNTEVLDQEMSFDGIHVSGGDWAMQNCKQIFYDI